jgi:hypothetical protein
LGVGSFSTQAGSYEQVTFGGVDQPTPFCIAAIAKKRSDPTKAFAATLYRVMPTEGISIAYSRKKPGHYKFSATGLIDPTRTAGRQMGVIQEMV